MMHFFVVVCVTYYYVVAPVQGEIEVCEMFAKIFHLRESHNANNRNDKTR